jgi:hypothetical protein
LHRRGGGRDTVDRNGRGAAPRAKTTAGGRRRMSPATQRMMPEGAVDSHSLGVSLGPVLTRECGGRLGPIEWFRAPWQRGGAATGWSTWVFDDGSAAEVMVKLPVGPVEHRWATRLGMTGAGGWESEESMELCTPRVLAAGDTLNGYDLAWLVMEKLHGHTLSGESGQEALTDLLRAAARLQARAIRAAPVEPDTRVIHWHDILGRARACVKTHGLPEAQRWNEAIHHVQRILPKVEPRWTHRRVNAWCHGDLHPGNAMRRSHDASGNGSPAKGCCVLIDLALMHPGHWVEDALYLERQFWGHGDMLDGLRPVSMLAKLRRELGLPTESDYAELADVRRLLTAACVPALLEREGNPRYLHAALEMTERLLHQVGR